MELKKITQAVDKIALQFLEININAWNKHKASERVIEEMNV